MIRKYVCYLGVFLALAACSPASTEKAGKFTSGVDVSHFQGDIDWSEVAHANIRFAYIKASEGLRTNDARFEINWMQAHEQGILVGSYHFFHPDEDAAAQAEHFLTQLKNSSFPTEGVLPPVLDIELGEGVKSAAFRADVILWLKTVEAALHCTPIIYTSPGFWASEDPGTLGNYRLWLADYAAKPTVPKGWDHWTFWQHTQNGKVKGITAAVDLDKFSGTRAELKALTCGVRR